MSTQRKYQSALIHVEQELEGLVGAAFVELRSGHVLAAHSVEPEFDQRAVVSAACSSLLAHFAIGGGGRYETLEDVVVTTGGHIHVYHLVSPAVFLSLSAARDETNLALVKAAARRCAERLELAESQAQPLVAAGQR
jgi:hypothetical protein